tara:strand:+ start:1016 stop:1273 length:258 start_codon:yes stop_codon:yes gene_type:complete
MSLKSICEKIHKLSPEDHIEILRIIKTKSNVNITENNNGCFINMKDIPVEVINEIKIYIDYKNKKDLELKNQEFIKENLIKTLTT